MKITTFLGNCCGFAQFSGLSTTWYSKRETKEERNIRVLKEIYTFVETKSGREGWDGSKKNEQLSAYVFADGVSNGNGASISKYITENKLGEVYESPQLPNTYSSHGGRKSPYDGLSIQLFIFYPNWEEFDKWYDTNFPKTT